MHILNTPSDSLYISELKGNVCFFDVIMLLKDFYFVLIS